MIFLRHTTPAINKGICYGITDLPLAEGYHDDFSTVMQSLPDISQIVCSPLQRCSRLAEHIGAQLGLRPLVNEDLREMDFGRWEMIPWDAVPRDELDEWADDFMNARPHGGENVLQLQTRVSDTLQSYETDTLIVTHSGVIRAAAALFDHTDGWNVDVKFGGWLRLNPTGGCET